jgi:hypothetical protein
MIFRHLEQLGMGFGEPTGQIHNLRTDRGHKFMYFGDDFGLRIPVDFWIDWITVHLGFAWVLLVPIFDPVSAFLLLCSLAKWKGGPNSIGAELSAISPSSRHQHEIVMMSKRLSDFHGLRLVSDHSSTIYP